MGCGGGKKRQLQIQVLRCCDIYVFLKKKNYLYIKKRSKVMTSVAVNVLTCLVMVLVLFYIAYSEHANCMRYWIVVLITSVVTLVCVSNSSTNSDLFGNHSLSSNQGSVVPKYDTIPKDFMSVSASSSASSGHSGSGSTVSSFSLTDLSV